MKWIFIYGFVIDRIGSAYIIFPTPVASGIRDIVFRKNACAQPCGGSPPELIAAAFQGIERIEISDRPHFKWSNGLIA